VRELDCNISLCAQSTKSLKHTRLSLHTYLHPRGLKKVETSPALTYFVLQQADVLRDSGELRVALMCAGLCSTLELKHKRRMQQEQQQQQQQHKQQGSGMKLSSDGSMESMSQADIADVLGEDMDMSESSSIHDRLPQHPCTADEALAIAKEIGHWDAQHSTRLPTDGRLAAVSPR